MCVYLPVGLCFLLTLEFILSYFRLPEPQYFQPEDLPSIEQVVSFETVLAALESISIPKTLRLNTKLHANDQKYGMCLGATKTYGRGVRASMDCVSRPNLTDLLVRFCKQARPDFEFTSIQVNKDYLAVSFCV